MNDTTDNLEALFDAASSQFSADSLMPAPAPTHVKLTPDLSEADQPIFDRLGGILRTLHDSLRELGYDRYLADVVVQVSDSSNRLEHIATLTEAAANKVLNEVDEGLPVQEKQAQAALLLKDRWNSMFAGALSVNEFKALAHDSDAFIKATADTSELEKERLLSIMMAQDFQDITGQIIKKVVALTQNLESQLAQLLRDNSSLASVEAEVDLKAGPLTSGMVQDDVDSLLSDLGF